MIKCSYIRIALLTSGVLCPAVFAVDYYGVGYEDQFKGHQVADLSINGIVDPNLSFHGLYFYNSRTETSSVGVGFGYHQPLFDSDKLFLTAGIRHYFSPSSHAIPPAQVLLGSAYQLSIADHLIEVGAGGYKNMASKSDGQKNTGGYVSLTWYIPSAPQKIVLQQARQQKIQEMHPKPEKESDVLLMPDEVEATDNANLQEKPLPIKVEEMVVARAYFNVGQQNIARYELFDDSLEPWKNTVFTAYFSCSGTSKINHKLSHMRLDEVRRLLLDYGERFDHARYNISDICVNKEDIRVEVRADIAIHPIPIPSI